MLHKLSANKATFREIEFKPGLNIILADRTKESTRKDSRNGLGKSTFVEILDFCLGASSPKGERLNIEPLQDWSFSLEMTVAGARIVATRSPASASRIEVGGDLSSLPVPPDESTEAGQYFYNLETWRDLLGQGFFRLPVKFRDRKFTPTYRSLMSYFLRKGLDAYTDPRKTHRNPPSWSPQVNISYLIGLNWDVAAQWKVLQDREAALTALRSSINSGALKLELGTTGELEAEEIRLQAQLEKERAAITSFRVHPQYREIEVEANSLTSSVHAAVNENVRSRRLLTRYRETIEKEGADDRANVERMYEELGITLPEAIVKSLEDVRLFHQTLLANRKAFLRGEIDRLNDEISSRDREIASLTDARADLLRTLENFGALEEMVELQGRLRILDERLSTVRSSLEMLRNSKQKLSDVDDDSKKVIAIAEADHEERKSKWAEATLLFAETVDSLYNAEGRFFIDIEEKRLKDRPLYKFSFEIPRTGSDGVEKMKVFAFDLMLLSLRLRQEQQLDFLVHDSIIFDGVDARQVALAMEVAQAKTQESGGQYICTINSDNVPYEEFSGDFDFAEHVRLTLTDHDVSGSLLGVRFERSRK